MNIDKTIEALESGYQAPTTAMYKVQMEDQYMEQIRVRRKKTGVTHHTLWCFSIGETGAAPAVFYDHKPSGAIKKALAWRGLPTSSRKKGDGPQPQQAA